jgi:hypothetical protein
MPSLMFEPPVTIEECRAVGTQLGEAWGDCPRLEFEEVLIGRMTAIGDAVTASGLDVDEAVAAFDQAAWAAWEAAQSEDPGDRAPARPARTRG